MKNIKKFLLTSLCLIFCLSLLTGCGEGEPPELTKSKVSQDLESELKEAAYNYDSLENFEYQLVDVTEDDLNKLKELFDSRVTYQKVDCNFQLTSIKMDTTAQYSMVYAYVNKEWQVMFSYEKNIGEWEYVPKETVSSKKLLTDLKTIEFEGFQSGYVGSEKNTSIKVTDRDTKLKINKDDVFTEVTVKTDFATYIIEVEMIYYFNKGEWELSDGIVQDSKFWQLTYDAEKIPSTPSEENILEQLTKSTNFLTYVANLDYMSDHNLVATTQLAGVSNITFQYEFSTTYDKIGTIKYLIQLPYEWVDGEWAIGDMIVEVSDININSMLGTWEADNGDYIEFASAEKEERSKYDSPNVLVGTYYKKVSQDLFSKYTLKVNVNVPLRDNNWEGNITLWEATDSNSVEYSINAFAIDVANKQLKSSDLVFSKTKDLEVKPDTGIEKDPEESGTSDTESVESQSDSSLETEESSDSSTDESESSEEKTEESTETSEKTESKTEEKTEETKPSKEGVSG